VERKKNRSGRRTGIRGWGVGGGESLAKQRQRQNFDKDDKLSSEIMI
jgi:hypothetical protein